MLPYIHNYTAPVQQSQENQQYVLEHMFPHHTTQKVQQTKKWLKKYYHKEQHSLELTNNCFRRHHLNMVQMYNVFREENHPQLTAPRISTFYDNDSFPNLLKVGKWLQSPTNQKYPIVHISPIPKDLGQTLQSIYSQHGYIPNLQRFLLFYPTLLSKLTRLSNLIFQSHHLDLSTIYFIASYASAQLGSVYILNRMMKKFRTEGGDIDWVQKQKYPGKFKPVLRLARRLARCPWEIGQEFITDIVGSQEYDAINNSVHWNQKELIVLTQAIVFVQFLAAISLALGLVTETQTDLLEIHKFLEWKTKWDLENHQTCHLESLSDIMPCLLQYTEIGTNVKSSMSKSVKKSFGRRFENDQNIEGYMKQIGSQLTQQKGYQILTSSLKPFLLPYENIPKRRQHKNPNIDYSQYNFQTNAYPVLSNFTEQAADCLSDLITYIEGMSSNNFGHHKLQNGDTKPFRRAVRFYSQNLCGYTRFNYKEALKTVQTDTKMLTLPLKFYIRLLTVSPMHISKQVIAEIKHQEEGLINCLDLGHLSILVANSKMLFGLMKVIQNLGE